uniref:Ankyrin repeat and sterile alpha motif domain-containing protein 1B n=1 Tax=Cacopsylla melanoneura TaxID=428564 RepID=A0A8D9B6D7_9HEMI
MGKDQELLEASRNGNIQVVDKILSQRAKRSGPLASLRRGPGANVQDSSGYSALHHAALNGHKEIVELLLTNEASVNIVDTKGSSPLHLAAWTGNLDIVRLLLCHGPSVPNVNLMTKDNETALHCASQYGHTPVVSLLLEHGCDPTIRNSRSETPLDLASQYGRLETVDTLVRTHPALIMAYNSRALSSVFPASPLHLASRNGHRSVVARLIQAGLDVNIRTASGTALHEAALCGKLEVVKTLLENGADLRITDSNHNTVLDLLKQFPPHAVQDISAIVHHYWYDTRDDHVPPIPVPPLGSPYENVKLKFSHSSPGASPSPWGDHGRDRRTSALSSASIKSMDPYHRHAPTSTVGLSRSLRETYSYFSDDLSCPQDLEDSLSVCSTASSSGGGSFYPSSNASKISPTPPKKPPRRNLSVSPSHLMSDLSVASAVMSYEFLVSGGGTRSVSDTDDMQLPCTPRGHPLRRGKSADHCTDFKLRYSSTIDIDGSPPSSLLTRGQSEDLIDSGKYQPIAITAVSENGPMRTTNPKRKLRRLTQDNGAQENTDPSKSLTSLLKRGDLPFKKIDPKEFMPQPITVERILSPSSDRSNITSKSSDSTNGTSSSNGTPLNGYVMYKRDDYTIVNDRIRVLSSGIGVTQGWPLSPTHYQQPPTPEHPPPSARQAEQTIQDRIRPLSQEYNNLKRKSRDMETETEEELLMLVFQDNSSLSSSVMSERSVSTQMDSLTPDVPYAGLLKGSVVDKPSSSTTTNKAERPTSLNQLKSVYDDTTPQPPSSATESNAGAASVLSPFDEQEEWARISEIMATFGTGLVKESTGFVTELEQEFQARLGLSRSGSLTDTGSPLMPPLEAPSSESSVETPQVKKTVASVTEWLDSLSLLEYKEKFVEYGYDNVHFMNGILTDSDLIDMGISNATHRETLLKSVESLPTNVKDVQAIIKKTSDKSDEDQIQVWLASIRLESYIDTFKKNLFSEMERIKKIWEVELTAVLEISKPAHRKRILVSLDRLSSGPNLEQIHSEVTKSSNNHSSVTTTKEKPQVPTKPNLNGTSGSETLRRNHKKSRPAPLPPPLQKELEESKKLKAIENAGENENNASSTSTKSNTTITTSSTNSTKSSESRSGESLKQSAQNLVNGSVMYMAKYLGSTVVKDKSTESNQQSIQKMRKQSKAEELVNTPEVLLSISHEGVKFLNPLNKSLVCEHEVRNIYCACVDPDDSAHFGYITKDHESGAHYTHVFFVKNSVQVSEILTTLGQAQEIDSHLSASMKSPAKPNNTSDFNTNSSHSTTPGHVRSRSINQVTPGTPPSVQHSRSLSVHEGSYLNGSGVIGEISIGKAPIACTEEL